MDQKTLVANHERNGRLLADALAQDDRLGLRAAFWWFDAEAERWSLVVASKLYRTHGPRAAYRTIAKHIAKLAPKRAIGAFIDLGNVVAVSDRDARAVALASAVAVTDGSTRIQSSMVNGVYVTDALVYELTTAEAKPTDGAIAESTTVGTSA